MESRLKAEMSLRKTPDVNGARSIAPHEMSTNHAEQCSALRGLGMIFP